MDRESVLNVGGGGVRTSGPTINIWHLIGLLRGKRGKIVLPGNQNFSPKGQIVLPVQIRRKLGLRREIPWTRRWKGGRMC